MGVKVVLDDTATTGIPLDALVLELKTAFILSQKNTDKENRIIAVQKHLCNIRGIKCEVIEKTAPQKAIEKKIKTVMRRKRRA